MKTLLTTSLVLMVSAFGLADEKPPFDPNTEGLVFEMPKHERWVVGNQSKTPTGQITEMVHAGEKIASWTHLVSMSQRVGKAWPTEAIHAENNAFLNLTRKNVEESYAEGCKESKVTVLKTDYLKIIDNYYVPRVIFEYMCKGGKRRAEEWGISTYLFTLQGGGLMWNLQRSFAKKPLGRLKAKWLEALTDATVCYKKDKKLLCAGRENPESATVGKELP